MSELRDLQAKAYRRGGGLTDAEAERLRALEAPETVAPLAEPEGWVAGPEVWVAELVEAPPGEERGPSTSSGTQEVEDPAEEPAPRRFNWKLLAAASILILLTGFAAGWMIFSPRPSGIELTADERQAQDEIEATFELDEGSVRPVRRDDDLMLWYALKDDGDKTCAILDVGDRRTLNCVSDDEVASGGAWVSMTLPGPPEESINAAAVPATTGEIVGVIQRYEMDPGSGWVAQFPPELQTRVQELIDLGFVSYSFNPVGSFQGAPVWSGIRSTDDGQQQCLVVDSVGVIDCGSGDGDDAELSVEVPDTGEGGWRVELRSTETGAEYLVISPVGA